MTRSGITRPFSTHRDRLLNKSIVRAFFNEVLALTDHQKLLSDEHFSLDGTIVEAWASIKSFMRKDGSTPSTDDQSRNPRIDFKGEQLSNDTHASRTDPDARPYKKSAGDKAKQCYLGHVLMENRSGLVIDVDTTQATGAAEREAAKTMIKR